MQSPCYPQTRVSPLSLAAVSWIRAAGLPARFRISSSLAPRINPRMGRNMGGYGSANLSDGGLVADPHVRGDVSLSRIRRRQSTSVRVGRVASARRVLISIGSEHLQPSPRERMQQKRLHSREGSGLNRFSKVAIRHQPAAPTVISAFSSRAPPRRTPLHFLEGSHFGGFGI